MKFLFFIIGFFYLNTVLGQGIPTVVKEIVGFIYKKDGNNNFQPQGTGFFVNVIDSVAQKGSVYLVTAKHVLKDNESFLDTIYLRLNRFDSITQVIPITIKADGPDKNLFMHSDKTVDIAVIPAIPNPSMFNYRHLSSNLLSNRKSFTELKIREGSDVFFTGMFTPYMGNRKIYPIVRFGRVALISEEKIPWDNELTELYLIESSTYGGNSGSPVFFYLGADRGGGEIFLGQSKLRLAGIMKGYFGESSPLKIIDTQKVPVSERNVGIAAVVPSYFLEEILFSPELSEIRGF